MEKKDKKLIKKAIAGALIGGTLVSFGLGTSNLIKTGNFELYKNNKSLVVTHEFTCTTIDPNEKTKSVDYISEYNQDSSIDQSDLFVFETPKGIKNGNIIIGNEAYCLNGLTNQEVTSLLKKLDLNKLEDAKILKEILLKMGSYQKETINSYMSPIQYEKEYENKQYNVTFYSYNHDFEKTKLQTIDPKELDFCDRNTTFSIGLGSIATALGFSVVELFSKTKPKRKVINR